MTIRPLSKVVGYESDKFSVRTGIDGDVRIESMHNFMFIPRERFEEFVTLVDAYAGLIKKEAGNGN